MIKCNLLLRKVDRISNSLVDQRRCGHYVGDRAVTYQYQACIRLAQPELRYLGKYLKITQGRSTRRKAVKSYAERHGEVAVFAQGKRKRGEVEKSSKDYRPDGYQSDIDGSHYLVFINAHSDKINY